MTKKIYIKLLVVIQIMVLGVMLISCEKDEKKDETGILLKQGASQMRKIIIKHLMKMMKAFIKKLIQMGK